MVDNGNFSSLLGMNVTTTEDSISLDQKLLINTALARFNFGDMKNINTPCDLIIKEDKHNDEIFENNTLYRAAVGVLNYIARCTRPDISFAVNYQSQKVEAPTKHDWNNVKRIFQFLKSTIDKKLTYTIEANSKVIGYAD